MKYETFETGHLELASCNKIAKICNSKHSDQYLRESDLKKLKRIINESEREKYINPLWKQNTKRNLK